MPSIGPSGGTRSGGKEYPPARPRPIARAPGGAAPVPPDPVRPPRTTAVAQSLAVVAVAGNPCGGFGAGVSRGAGAYAGMTGVAAPGAKRLTQEPAAVGLVRF